MDTEVTCKRRSHLSCCVPCCTNTSQNSTREVTFHCFPKNTNLRKVWITKIKRDVGKKFKITDATKVCSDHFNKSDFRPLLHSTKRYLKSDAFPSCFQWISAQKQSNINARDKRTELRFTNRSSRKNENEIVLQVNNEENIEIVDAQINLQGEVNPLDELEKLRADLKLQIEATKIQQERADKLEVETEKIRADNKILQQEVAKLKEALTNQKNCNDKLSCCLLTFDNIKKSKKLVNFYTGLPNEDAFEALFQYFNEKAENLFYWRGKNTRLLAKKGKSRISFNLNTKEMFFLTLVRLKLAFPMIDLARTFGVSVTSVNRIFTTWVTFLHHELVEIFTIPPPAFIKSKCPNYFKNYSNTTLIIDCSEIKIQTPSRLCAQRETFSNYKHSNTYKFLIAITPNGTVVYVSPLFGGSSSDRKIVKESGFLELLSSGHNIMADKGFEIDDILPAGIELNIPPKFMQKITGQIPEEDVTRTRQIATERIEVERAIRRIKTYRILTVTQPLSSIDTANQVVSVCAYLTNFKPALRK